MEANVKEVLWELPNLRFVRLETGNYCLIVESISLNDFVEDFLWDEYQYEATSVTMENSTSIPIYYNFLTHDLPITKFIERLNELNAMEIQEAFNQAI